jgi:hypothetical protein
MRSGRVVAGGLRFNEERRDFRDVEKALPCIALMADTGIRLGELVGPTVDTF